ncbi:MAG TPA: M48 family metallopeptidase [Burkholderiaceae bacterium]|nr:M48 family metallopeptidase [Burkholderiaceae bacterium]
MALDPRVATAAYIDSIGADALAKSAAYTSGNHWLLLWGLLVTIAVAWLIIRTGVLERIDARMAKRGFNARAFLVSLVYFVLAGILSLPWAMYRGWFRETSYGRSSQPFGDALLQNVLGIAISALLGGLFFMGVYALIRRTGKRWWLWSGALAIGGISAVLLVAPVVIEPLFNEYKPLPEGQVRSALTGMAEAAGIPADRIFVYDGSRQSNNFTANVSGIGPYARIAISDIALKGASLDEVRAVTAHEIGHYTLRHVWRSVVLLSLIVMIALFVAGRSYGWVAVRMGSRAPLASPTGLPVVMVMVSFLFLLALPLVNAFTRIGETEADRHSLETAQLPDALASALVKTAEYRYPRPNAVQEFLFYSHPSVERRVRMAMDWKAANAAGPAQ